MKKASMLLSAIALMAGAGALIPAQADPPPWAPAYGYRAKQHTYIYYPALEVYYAPETRVWFWISDGNWQFGATLPAEYRPYATGGVSIVLDAERPYEQHAYVVERFGKPKEHRHWEDEDDDDDDDD